MKYCSKCGCEKPHSDFWKNRSTKDGYQSYCKPCWKAATYYDLNAEQRAARKRVQRNSRLRRSYNLTLEAYEALLATQGRACAICRKPENKVIKGVTAELSVDHDHRCCRGKKSCGKCIRGLLCSNCNLVLGKVNDDPDLLDAAKAYLAAS